MNITKEFLQAEIASIEQEMENARIFQIRGTAAISVHKMLLAKLDEPEPSNELVTDSTDLSTTKEQ